MCNGVQGDYMGCYTVTGLIQYLYKEGVPPNDVIKHCYVNCGFPSESSYMT